MADRPYELLVHTTAPLARDEALYRGLATAYFDFAGPTSPETGDKTGLQSYVVAQDRDIDMANSNSESQQQSESQPQHDTLLAFMSPTGADFWTPDTQLEISQKKTYLTRSRLGTSSAAPPASSAAPQASVLQASLPASMSPRSQASFMSTLPSTPAGTLDGMNSPRFTMPSQVGGPAYQWESQSSGLGGSRSFGMGHATQKSASQPESSGSFHAPPSTVPDSMTQGYNPVPAWSTSQVVMESFLSHFQTQSSTSNTTSSPSVRSQKSVGTMGSQGSLAPRGGQMPPNSQNSASNQSSCMRSSIRPSLLDNGRKAPQVSPPKPRRQRQVSPASRQPRVSHDTPASGQAPDQQISAKSGKNPASPVPSDEDEQPAATLTSPATPRGDPESTYIPQQHAVTHAPLPVPNHVADKITATPTPPDTPLRDPKKRRASNTPSQASTSQASKRPNTHASRLQALSEVPRTPAAMNGAGKTTPQVPFTGSFNVPASSHHMRQVRNASFGENITRISDTPPNAAKLPPQHIRNDVTRPSLPLNTSISVVPDTPTPAPNPAPTQPPPSSAIPPQTIPQSSAPTASKPTSKPKRLSTHSLTAYEIHPPPPLPGTAPIPTFITPFLTKIANQMSYSRYDPTTVLRALRKDERGYWVFSLPDDVGGWSHEMRQETWSYLEKIVGKGRAGWNVHVYRSLWEGTSDGEVNGKGKGKEGDGEKGWKGEEWRVYCWGEIVGQVYLLLFLASSRKVRGLGATWVDGEGRVVVRMGSERRVKT